VAKSTKYMGRADRAARRGTVPCFGVRVYRRFVAVAAAILAVVEGGILPPGMGTLNAEMTA